MADARALVDWLAARPEVVQDGPGDPRVGITGGSYGGALSLLLAGYDRRVDALAPVITWNDLGQALFPNAAAGDPAAGGHPGARGVRAGRGVQVRLGRDLLLGRAGPGADRRRPPADAGHRSGGGLAGATGGPGAAGAGAATDPAAGTAPRPTPPGAGPATCGRFVPAVCAAYTESATTGRLSPATAELLRRSSPASVTDRITAPTLLVQGEQDTLFGLDQADANARQIAATGAPVKVAWFAGGHDGGRIGQRRPRRDRRLVHLVPRPGRRAGRPRRRPGHRVLLRRRERDPHLQPHPDRPHRRRRRLPRPARRVRTGHADHCAAG